jgi:Carboxypeptidase regulatory-like domain
MRTTTSPATTSPATTRPVFTAFAVAALAVTALAGCARTGPAGPDVPASRIAASNSGVQGRTVVDAGCPMVRDDSGCPERPLAARITVTTQGHDATVATATTGPDGTFRIPLPPGDYTLHPANLTGAVLPASGPQEVTVHAGQYTTITVPFDSGVR